MPGLSDGLGDRLLMFDNTETASLELLRFRQDFGSRREFETAVRTRLRELERFTHPGVAQVRALKRLGEGEGLALVSNHVAGRRLSEILHAARGPALGLDLIRQITPVLAGLQQQGDNIAHGVLTPERIIVTPEGRLVMVEHVLGAALQTVNWPAARLRTELGLGIRGAHAPLDSRGDVIQLGLAALSLVLGRRVAADEFPLRVAALLDELEGIDAPGASDFSRLRRWMQHALQLGGRAFGSAIEAYEALREVLEERDDAPRQNVIAFPAQADASVIEIETQERPVAAARSEPPPPRRTHELDMDVAAIWRAAEASGHAQRFEPIPFEQPIAVTELSDEPAGPDMFQAPAWSRPSVFAAARFAMAQWIRNAIAYRLTTALAVVCALQTLVIIGLIVTPPAPVIIERRIEVPVPASQPRPPAATAPGPATTAPRTAPQASIAWMPTPKPEPTFGQMAGDAVKQLPATIGRGIAAIWNATAANLRRLFTRNDANGAR
jgi:hypothetical protein